MAAGDKPTRLRVSDISSVQMAERLAITQKSAWRLRNRIREAMTYRGVTVYEREAFYETRRPEFGALPLLKAILGSPNPQETSADQPQKFVDLFCGIGGFHIAGTNLGLDPVFACDIDENARSTYRANFGLDPAGDITALGVDDIPDHDLLFAGFPCQPFSIIGNRRAFADPRGTLWFELVRIINGKRPRGLVLENVKQLTTVSRGSVIRQILKDLTELGYSADFRILNALDFGLPQKRERTIIVATLDKFDRFPWPTEPPPMKPLSEILEQKPHPKYYASERIRLKRQTAHQSIIKPAIWHENKAGNVSSHPWACALRAGASYNYLLVDGERRLTPREMLRLQGFPDEFMIVCNDSQTRKQVGNAVPVPMVEAAIKGVLNVLQASSTARGPRLGEPARTRSVNYLMQSSGQSVGKSSTGLRLGKAISVAMTLGRFLPKPPMESIDPARSGWRMSSSMAVRGPSRQSNTTGRLIAVEFALYPAGTHQTIR